MGVYSAPFPRFGSSSMVDSPPVSDSSTVDGIELYAVEGGGGRIFFLTVKSNI